MPAFLTSFATSSHNIVHVVNCTSMAQLGAAIPDPNRDSVCHCMLSYAFGVERKQAHAPLPNCLPGIRCVMLPPSAPVDPDVACAAGQASDIRLRQRCDVAVPAQPRAGQLPHWAGQAVPGGPGHPQGPLHPACR